MKWATSKNNKVIKTEKIPVMELSALKQSVSEKFAKGRRVIGFFATKEESSKSDTKLYVVLADDMRSHIEVASAVVADKYESITRDVPQFHKFEREVHEDTGIIPEGHPWLKPVRFPYNRPDRLMKMEDYPFFKMEGEEVHEVAVGPVHAGVIEPGHFRFMCHGEDVYHLEIQLGYQHRGVENLFLKKKDRFQPHLAESIAGDSVVAHASAYAAAMESLTEAEISEKAELIRGICLELERAAVHIGDLSAIANDVAFLIGNAVFGALRTLIINTSLAICGSRFGRGLIRVGGVAFDINQREKNTYIDTITKVKKEFEDMTDVMFSAASVLARLQRTGVVTTEQAKEIGLVGLAARASGVPLDIRDDHPFGAYKHFPVYKNTLDSGDVFARSFLRYVETVQSLGYALEHLQNLPEGETMVKVPCALKPDSFVVSMTESWRGEVVHIALTDKAGNLQKYKVKDPSFNNWYGLGLAVRNNGISDFPLCNKSFNLSYCGNDL